MFVCVVFFFLNGFGYFYFLVYFLRVAALVFVLLIVSFNGDSAIRPGVPDNSKRNDSLSSEETRRRVLNFPSM